VEARPHEEHQKFAIGKNLRQYVVPIFHGDLLRFQTRKLPVGRTIHRSKVWAGSSREKRTLSPGGVNSVAL
jgi:hypothetical protein